MNTPVVLVVVSIGISFLMERHETTRRMLRNVVTTYTPGTSRSFILDIFFLLPIVGILVEILVRRLSKRSALVLYAVIAFALGGVGTVAHKPIIGVLGYAIMAISTFRLLLGAKTPHTLRISLYTAASGIFIAISGLLYFDYLNFYFLAPILGHPEAWSGNHFMWNSGIELLKLPPLMNGAPTYHDFWGTWNVFGMLLFTIYPLVMIKMGCWLHGLLFGYTEKQTGVSALFFERKTK